MNPNVWTDTKQYVLGADKDWGEAKCSTIHWKTASNNVSPIVWAHAGLFGTQWDMYSAKCDNLYRCSIAMGSTAPDVASGHTFLANNLYECEEWLFGLWQINHLLGLSTSTGSAFSSAYATTYGGYINTMAGKSNKEIGRAHV